MRSDELRSTVKMMMYFYEFENRSGIDNMAVDEALLETARQLDTPILRFYTWNEPTVSLGYFQHYEERNSHPASLACPAVRRLTGGGAIVHDRELTYCFAVPPGHELARKHRLRLYETIHRAVIGVLSDEGIDAFLASEVESLTEKQPDKRLFLCFQRIAPGDVVAWSDETGWTKLLGSAQYRDKHGAVLQHGSLLWERSGAAPELPGLKDFRRTPFEVGRMTNPKDCEFYSRYQRPTEAGWPNGAEALVVPPLWDEFRDRLTEVLPMALECRLEALQETIRKEMESSIAILREKRYADSWIKKK